MNKIHFTQEQVTKILAAITHKMGYYTNKHEAVGNSGKSFASHVVYIIYSNVFIHLFLLNYPIPVLI